MWYDVCIIVSHLRKLLPIYAQHEKKFFLAVESRQDILLENHNILEAISETN